MVEWWWIGPLLEHLKCSIYNIAHYTSDMQTIMCLLPFCYNCVAILGGAI